jgi:hypothetical protein
MQVINRAETVFTALHKFFTLIRLLFITYTSEINLDA